MNKKVLKTLIAASLISSIASIAFAQVPIELATIINRIKNLLQALGSMIAVVFVIIGGYQILTAGGSAEKVESGRKWILYAVVGLVVVLIAQVLAKVGCYIATGNWTCPS